MFISFELIAENARMFEEGIGALGAYCKGRKWALFTPRPKLHMQQEIMNLWRTCFTCMDATSIDAWECILVRMWMQDQVDAGAEFVLSPHCHEPSMKTWACMTSIVLASICICPVVEDMHAWSTSHKACIMHTCAAHKACMAMQMHTWHAWHAWLAG